jgi:hypothetical protein
MIVMTFTVELDIGLSYLLQSAAPLAGDRSRDDTHRRGRSKRSYDADDYDRGLLDAYDQAVATNGHVAGTDATADDLSDGDAEQ